MPWICIRGILLYIVYKNEDSISKFPKMIFELPFCFFLRYTKIEIILAFGCQ